MAYRFIGFLVLALAAVDAWADAHSGCTVPLDALVLRAGSAEIAVPAPPTSSSTLSLAAMGRLAAGGRSYSIWRVRNSGGVERRIVVRSADTLASGVFDVSARSDLFVRSEVARGAHLLIADGAELSRLSPSSAAWSDPRAIPDPLCYEPATTLWVQHATGVMRVSPIDGRVLLDIPAQSASAVFAVDPVDGSVWIWDAPRMLHVDSSGVARAHGVSGSQLMSSARTQGPRLAVDDAHRLWIGLGHQVLMAAGTDAPKSLITLSYVPLHLSFDSRSHALWVGGMDRVSAWPTEPADTPTSLPLVAWSAPALRLMTPDSFSGGIWIVAGSRLLDYDISGQLRGETALQGRPPFTAMSGDPAGGVWLAGALRLAHFSASAVPDVAASSVLLPMAVAADSHAGTVWVASPERVVEYSETGRPIPIGGRQASDALTPAPGVALVTTRLITGLQIFVDRSPPRVEFVTPATGAIVNVKRPPIVFRVRDLEGHVSWDSLALGVNGAPAALVCANLVEPEVQCVLQDDLPEGSVSLVLTASDDGGNASAAELGITVDTRPPAAAAADRIQVHVSGDLVSVIATEGAAEPGAVVHVVNARAGSRADGIADADGSFVISLVAASGDALEITLSDGAGNTSTPVHVPVPATSASLEVIEPADGITVSVRDLLVRGTVTGEAGVSVNSRPVTLVPSGNARSSFTVRVALASGANVIDAIAHLQSGEEIHASRTVSLNEPDPFGVRASLQAGVAPLTVRFAINEYTSLRATQVSVDFEGSGTAADAAPNLEQSHTYENAGEYTAAITVRGEDGSLYRYRVPVTVMSPDDLDRHLQIVWQQFIDGLSSADPSSASQFMEAGLASRFEDSFDALGTRLPTIVASFSRPVLTSASSTLAEYILTRDIEGSTRAFAVYFRLGADGIWRVASL